MALFSRPFSGLRQTFVVQNARFAVDWCVLVSLLSVVSISIMFFFYS